MKKKENVVKGKYDDMIVAKNQNDEDINCDICLEYDFEDDD